MKTFIPIAYLFFCGLLSLFSCSDSSNSASAIPKTNEVKDSLFALKSYERGIHSLDSFQFDSAQFYFNQSAKIYRALNMKRPYFRAKDEVGKIWIAKMRYLEATPHFEDMLTESLAFFGERDSATAKVYMRLGECVLKQGYPDSSITLYNKALDIYMDIFGENSEIVGDTYTQFFLAIQNKGIKREYLRKAIKVCQNTIGENHPKFFNLEGEFFNQIPDVKEKVQKWEKLLTKVAKIYGEESLELATAILQRGYIRLPKYEKKSIESIKWALDLRRAHFGKKDPLIGEAYSLLGWAYTNRSNEEKLLKNYEEAKSIFAEVYGKNNARVGLIDYEIGQYFQQKAGKYESALKYYSLGAENLKANELWGKYFFCLIGIGESHNKLFEFEEQLAISQKILKMSQKYFGEISYQTGYAYNEIGSAYQGMGEIYQGIEYLKKSLFVRSSLVEGDIGNSYNNLGAAYFELNDYDKGIIYHQKAIEAWSKIYLDTLHYSHAHFGRYYNWKGELDKALHHYEKALKITLKHHGENHDNTANYKGEIGAIHQKKGNSEMADFFLESSLSQMLKASKEKNPNVSLCFMRLGLNSLEKRELDQSLLFFQKALIALSSNFDDLNLQENPSLSDIYLKPFLLRALNFKTSTLLQKFAMESRDLKDLQLAHNTFNHSLNLIDSLRFEYRSDLTKQHFIEESMPIFESAIQTSVKLFEETKDTSYLKEAFLIVERSKSFLMLQQLKDNEAKKFSNIPQKLIEKERTIRKKIAFSRKKLSIIEKGKDSLENHIFELNRQYDTLIQQLETDYPKYFQLKYDIKTLSIDEVQNQLPNDSTAILNYFAGDSTIYIFAISKREFQFVSFPTNGDLKYRVDDFRTALMSRDLENYVCNGYDLYTQLFEPLNVWFKERGIRKLMLIPDRELGYIPFEILLSKPIGNQTDYRKQPYLLRDYLFSYHNSATLAFTNFQTRSGRDCLAFAYSSGGTLDGQINFREVRDKRLGELRGAYEEVLHISELTTGKCFTGKTATEYNFKQYAKDFSIIHLATHGTTDSISGPYARVLFRTEQDTVEDGSLHAYELYNMELNANLAVLSACETGTGQLVRGEGIMSLSRGFQYAGCPSVVAGLWSMPDMSTGEVVKYFYEGVLKENLPKDEALRQAKLNYLSNSDNRGAAPFFWAGMVLIGDSAPLPLAQSNNWGWILGSALILSGIGFYWRYRERTN